MGATNIEWTDHVWNPIIGCSIVSPGCTNCYAMKQAARLLDKPGSHYEGTTKTVNGNAVWTGKVALAPEHILTAPLGWPKPRRIFVNSMGDLFHEDVPDGWIMTVFDVMWRAPQHTYQILTKRPHRMRAFMAKWCDLSGEDFGEFRDARGPDAARKAHPSGRGQLFAAFLDTLLERSGGKIPDGAAWPTFDWMNGVMHWPDVHPRIWLGVSAEDQARADERIPDLLATPAAVRFVSAEPLLGPLDFKRICLVAQRPGSVRAGIHLNSLAGRYSESNMPYIGEWDVNGPAPVGWPSLKLDWIITGGESGANARDNGFIENARGILRQCRDSGVPFFGKQNVKKIALPEDLMVREFPHAR